MKNPRTLLRPIVTLVTTGTLIASGMGVASANESEIMTPNRAVVAHSCGNVNPAVPYGYSNEEIDAELTLLSNLPVEHQERLIREGLGLQPKQDRIAPLVIVAAIGCAVSVGSGIFATDWSSASSVAWALAGALLSCIPGANQAKLVSLILKHRVIIARALKAAGAVAAGNALLAGDSRP